MSSQRRLRARFAIAGLSATVGWGCGSDEHVDSRVDPDASDAQVDPTLLVSPREAEDLDPDPQVLHARLVAAPAMHSIGGRAVEGYAYNGQTPGPTLRASIGDRLRVELVNQLDEPTTIHWHGMSVPYDMDGVTWKRDPIAPGNSFTYEFSLTHAGTFWYHPHFNSKGQVDRGLYGVVIVEDPAEPALEDLVVVFDVWDEGEPVPGGGIHGTASDAAMPPMPHAETTDSSRTFWTANSLDRPRAILDGGKSVRVRLLNAGTLGYLDLRWPSIRQIGSDQGLLPALAEPASLVLAPGDRAEAEWLVGEQGFAVETAPYSLNGGSAPGVASEVLAVEVDAPGPSPPSPSWPFSDRAPTLDPGTTDIVYVFTGDPHTGDWRINGELFPDVTVEEVGKDSEVVIEIRNASPTEHPFHLHGHAFEVLSTDGVQSTSFTLEDTVNVPVRGRVRLRLIADNPGDWMAHCHILDHADRGMMTVLRVLDR